MPSFAHDRGVEQPTFLRRLSRTCGVLIVVFLIFAPFSWWRDGCVPYGQTWFTFLERRWERLHSRPFALPLRALDPRSSESERVQAMWSVEAPVVLLLLGSLPACASMLILASRRTRTGVTLLASIAGGASASALVIRAAWGEGGIQRTDFDERSLGAELGSWALALAPMGLGAATAFGWWQGRVWRRGAMLCCAGVAVFVALASQESWHVFWGAGAVGSLYGVAILLESQAVRLSSESDAAQPASPEGIGASPHSAPPRWQKAADRLSLIALVLSITLALPLVVRAMRPPKINDPLDNWPFFVDVNAPPHHTGTINGLVFAPKGDVIASWSSDETIRIWSVDTGVLLHTIRCGRRPFDVAFSPAGDLLAASLVDGGITFYSVPSGDIVRVLGEGGTGRLAFSSSGRLLAAVRVDGTGVTGHVKVWTLPDGGLVRELAGRCFAFSPDGGQIATGDYFGAKIWSLRDGSLVRALEGSRGVLQLAFSSESLVAASRPGDEPDELVSWSVTDGSSLPRARLRLSEKGKEQNRVSLGRSIAFSPDGALLVVFRTYGSVWTTSPSSLEPLSCVINQMTDAFAWSPRNDRIAIAEGRIRLQAPPTQR